MQTLECLSVDRVGTGVSSVLVLQFVRVGELECASVQVQLLRLQGAERA